MLSNDPQWYKDAVIYEVHVRAYCDSVGDGYGDFRGLTQKLDYLQDLGVTAIWLLPFYPSPLRDDGYDIADYTNINPQYGTLPHFREFLDQAHERGLRVITELVLNHTSDQHPWFQRARRAAPGTPERDFYVWNDTPERYRDARIIFKDFETSNWAYDQVARAYYWHRFYSHQPDLNFDNPAVWQALLPVVDFWFEMGVDGLRLDAVPYLYERSGTNCENLPETHEFLKALRKHVDERYPNRMLLAEANQWPEDAVAYFGSGDECHMAFHFPVMPRLFMAMHMEDRFPVVDILDQTPAVPANCQWALFLRNHDELTLEMVTDEERDYMYRAYAHDRQARVNLGIRRRLAPLLGNNRRRIELMNGLLFSLPGTPVLYYGDEIGMGDNIYLGDRNGVRTPMQWSSDRNAGFSRANPQQLYLPIIIDPEYHFEAISVESQQNNPSSLLWWMKRLIGHRRLHKAFGRGSIQFLHPENRRILAFFRRFESEFESEEVLVVANLSRFVQYVELDLAAKAGSTLVEIFGGTQFPQVGTAPYMLTLAPHSFYWFSLTAQEGAKTEGAPLASLDNLAEIYSSRNWEQIFTNSGTRQLEVALRQFFDREGIAGPQRTLRIVRLRESFRLLCGESAAYLAIVDVEFNRGTLETFVVSLAFATVDEAAAWPATASPKPIARVAGPNPGVLYEAVSLPAFGEALLQAVAQGSSVLGNNGGELMTRRSPAFDELRGPELDPLPAGVVPFDQANKSIRFGNRLILKLYRRIEEGIHPELEMCRFLTEDHPAGCVAPLAGSIEYRRRRNESMALAVMHGYVANEGDAWQYSLDVLSVYFEHVTTRPPLEKPPPLPLRGRLGEDGSPPPEFAAEVLHGFLEMVQVLGRRLGELHCTLASAPERPEFAPEPITLQYQRAVYQSMRNVLFDAFHDLERESHRIPPTLVDKAMQVRRLQPALLKELRSVIDRRIHAMRIRCHGDCRLHQVLFTGKDFVFIDLEGRPRQSIGERRIKRSPVADVVSLLHSFDSAAYAALWGLASSRGRAMGMVRDEDRPALLPWANAWRSWTHNAFMRGYLDASAGAALLPRDEQERTVLFRVLLIDQLLMELARELRTCTPWLEIPLSGLLEAVSPVD
jgi:maltose alpha-D-glucosyltransferase/alpha-amylase